MKSPIRRALLLALCLPPSLAGSAEPVAVPIRNLGLVLLQPEALMTERGIGTEALDAYGAALLTAASATLNAQFQRRPASGFIALALRPAGRSRAWFDLSPALLPSTEDALRRAIEAVPPPAVQSGTVVFGIKLTVWGGSPPTRVAPAPNEWKAQAQKAGQRLEVGALVDQLWTD